MTIRAFELYSEGREVGGGRIDGRKFPSFCDARRQFFTTGKVVKLKRCKSWWFFLHLFWLSLKNINVRWMGSIVDKKTENSIAKPFFDVSLEMSPVMLIFNRFFDDRLNRVSKNRFFYYFLKFDFDWSIILKSKNRFLIPHKCFGTKFNFKQLSFDAFFEIMRTFGSNEP